MRYKISKILLLLSNYLKVLSKYIIKDTNIVVDVLSLPGWVIIDNCLIHEVSLRYDKRKIGFEWQYYSMPDEWYIEMKRLEGKIRKKK